MEFLKKTWKFITGALVMLFGILIFFRKKDDVATLIEESTEGGNKSLENIISKKEILDEELEVLDKNHIEKIEKIKKVFEEAKARINPVARQKIENAIKDGKEKRATELLSSVAGIKNLD